MVVCIKSVHMDAVLMSYLPIIICIINNFKIILQLSHLFIKKKIYLFTRSELTLLAHSFYMCLKHQININMYYYYTDFMINTNNIIGHKEANALSVNWITILFFF